MRIYVRKDEIARELNDFFIPSRIALAADVADLIKLRDHLDACISEMNEGHVLEGRHMLDDPTEANADIVVISSSKKRATD